MSEKLKNKINAVKQRRFDFLCECFSDELSFTDSGIYHLQELNILENRKANLLASDYGYNHKTVFTKKFVDFYISELNIKDPLCKKILKKLRFEKMETEKGEKAIVLEYNDEVLPSLNNREWECIRKLLSEYKKIKESFLNEKERKEIIVYKKRLCQLTDCYKNPDAVKIICESCGMILEPEIEFCIECGAEVKE